MRGLVLLADPEIAAVRVEECHEGLVGLREQRHLLLDDRKRDPRGAFALLREGLVDRLVRAQAVLPIGIRLLIVEGYRPLPLQRRYFSEYELRLRRAHPDWDAATVRRQASRYISPPEVAPHCTGGAVDLTLCAADGVELDMGTPVNATPEESDGACFTAATSISRQAARNRRVLTDVLVTAGLVNYPTEWWHWSYGERYWAFATGAPAAVFGPVNPLPLSP
ncbi:MAG: M15 family metallopeptidase [Egibacteraceae bacterium]